MCLSNSVMFAMTLSGPDFKVAVFFKIKYVKKTVQDKAIVTTEH